MVDNITNEFSVCRLNEIISGQPLPVALYIFIVQKFVCWRQAGDVILREELEKLRLKKVDQLYVRSQDHDSFRLWSAGLLSNELSASPDQWVVPARDALKKPVVELFSSQLSDPVLAEAMKKARALVEEILKKPYVAKNLTEIQRYSGGLIDHSMNVAVLSGYLALQLGYTHSQLLENIVAGALFHDIGKIKISLNETETELEQTLKLKTHCFLGVEVLGASSEKVPQDVMRIVLQHHEYSDGSGYPDALRGDGIYDLAKIVCIANFFDGLVMNGSGSLMQRQRRAVQAMDIQFYSQFDSKKLLACLNVLKLGI